MSYFLDAYLAQFCTPEDLRREAADTLGRDEETFSNEAYFRYLEECDRESDDLQRLDRF